MPAYVAYEPTAAEIEAACSEIQKTWTEIDYLVRRGRLVGIADREGCDTFDADDAAAALTWTPPTVRLAVRS